MSLFQFRRTTSISGGIPANVGDWVRLSRSSPSYLSFWRSSSSSLSASSSTSSCRLLPTPCATFYLRDRLAPCYYRLLSTVDKLSVFNMSVNRLYWDIFSSSTFFSCSKHFCNLNKKNIDKIHEMYPYQPFLCTFKP